MAGHSKWANTKHRKSAQDERRASVGSKLIREITVAVRAGGPELENNPSLRSLIERASAANLKRSTIDGAIARASSSAAGSGERLLYEGYGPGGVAILVECMSDNRNRSIAQVRHAFSACACRLGTAGSVAYLFERRGEIVFRDMSDEALLELFAVEGVIDADTREGKGTLVTTPESLSSMASVVASLGAKVRCAQTVYAAQDHVAVDEAQGQKLTRLLEQLEALEDVEQVYHNAELC